MPWDGNTSDYHAVYIHNIEDSVYTTVYDLYLHKQSEQIYMSLSTTMAFSNTARSNSWQGRCKTR